MGGGTELVDCWTWVRIRCRDVDRSGKGVRFRLAGGMLGTTRVAGVVGKGTLGG